MLMPTIADSEIGVSTTRISPNSSKSPWVTPNAPPYGPTSSPSTNTFGSRRISSASASRIASRYDSSLLMLSPKLSTTEDTEDTEDQTCSYNRIGPPCPPCPLWWRAYA
jgi:hypothetical protein